MCAFSRISLGILLPALIFGWTAKPAQASISEKLCQQLREASQKANVLWFGLDRSSTLTPLKGNMPYEQNKLNSIVYLHTRDDKVLDSTVVAVKIAFHTQGNHLDQDWIRAQNNFKILPSE